MLKPTPYPAYKPSDVKWLGDIPIHWEVRRLRNIVEMRVSNVDKHVKEDEKPVRLCNYVDVYKNDYINSKMDFMQATATSEEIERFRLEKDDVLITKDSESWDDIGVPALVTEPASDLISGYHLALLCPRSEKIAGGYLLRALQSNSSAYQFHIEAKGVTRYGLSHAGIKSAWLPVPPLLEQSSIIRYLDHATENIRRYISAKEWLINLLEEQRQAVIQRAVTRGLDPNVRLKPSGVEWLGDVPAHWELRRLKISVANIINQTSQSNEHELCLALEDVESWTGRYNNARQGTHLDSQVKQFRANDVLFGKLRPYLAKVVRPDKAGTCVSEFLVLRPRNFGLSASYLEQLLRSKPMIDAINSSTFGAKMPRADWQFISNMLQPLPPLPEQIAIVDYLEETTANTNTTTSRTRQEIELLKEFRTRLIADVVTGKLDVRQAAFELPEKSDRLSPYDDVNDLTEIRMIDARAH